MGAAGSQFTLKDVIQHTGAIRVYRPIVRQYNTLHRIKHQEKIQG